MGLMWQNRQLYRKYLIQYWLYYFFNKFLQAKNDSLSTKWLRLSLLAGNTNNILS